LGFHSEFHSGQLSSGDFVYLQEQFCEFFLRYQKFVFWIRDAGTHAGYDFTAQGNHHQWKTFDNKMREELEKFMYHPTFTTLIACTGGIQNSAAPIAWWW
jgi:hypothetical protein